MAAESIAGGAENFRFPRTERALLTIAVVADFEFLIIVASDKSAGGFQNFVSLLVAKRRSLLIEIAVAAWDFLVIAAGEGSAGVV